MKDRFSESDLLAFIEDEMSPRKRVAFAARLERDPGLRTRVDAMRSDRAVLRSLPEPALPVDFLAALEPQLARPLLTSPSPGAYRRYHSRTRRRRRIVRGAIAALFITALLAGVWGAAVLAPRLLRGTGGTESGDQVVARSLPRNAARADREASGPVEGPAAGPAAGMDGSWPPPGTIVHHRMPLPPMAEATARADAGSPVAGRKAADPASASLMPATPFALVLPIDDPVEGETLVGRIVTELFAVPETVEGRGRRPELHAAIVRNFNMAEAQRLVQRLGAEREASGGGPRLSGLNGSFEGAAGRRRIVAELRRLRGREELTDDDPRAGARLLGPAELAPDYERQLELSAAGATHTITLPADRLPEFLSRLRVTESHGTMLRPMEDDAAPDARSDLQRWVEDYRTIRAFVADLNVDGNGYVMLPVVMRRASD